MQNCNVQAPQTLARVAQVKQDFPRDGSAATPPHPGTDFLWKDYCPRAFRELRRTFSIDAAPYLQSICGARLPASAAPCRPHMWRVCLGQVAAALLNPHDDPLHLPAAAHPALRLRCAQCGM